MIKEIKKITDKIAASDDYSYKYAEHIAELLAVVRAEMISDEYKSAIEACDLQGASATLQDTTEASNASLSKSAKSRSTSTKKKRTELSKDMHEK